MGFKSWERRSLKEFTAIQSAINTMSAVLHDHAVKSALMPVADQLGPTPAMEVSPPAHLALTVEVSNSPVSNRTRSVEQDLGKSAETAEQPVIPANFSTAVAPKEAFHAEQPCRDEH